MALIKNVVGYPHFERNLTFVYGSVISEKVFYNDKDFQIKWIIHNKYSNFISHKPIMGWCTEVYLLVEETTVSLEFADSYHWYLV